jgi:hypothetical protein
MIRKHRLLFWVKVKAKAKAYGGIETWLPSFLTPLDGDERSAPCPVALLPLKATSIFIEEEGGSVGPRAGLDAPEERQISCTCRESSCVSLVVQPVACIMKTKLFSNLLSSV